MKRIPKGKLKTSDKIKLYLTNKNHTGTTRFLTAGIFVNDCANASVERDNNSFP